MHHLLLALWAMFVQQTFVALGRALPAVIAPAIITDLRLDPAWIGVYFGVMALSALFAQLGCGSFIVRYGALRVSQIALVMLAAGTALAALGTPLPLILSAVIGGGGGAVSTPASSHLLSRCTSPRYLPLVFSIKQTAVPAGLLLAGVLSFGQVGALALPLIYSGFLDQTGSYGIGFIVCGLPALLVGVQLLRQRASARR